MRITLAKLICILVSGCGLFKKTTKHKEETLSKRELQVSDKSKESLTANKNVTISDKKLTVDKSGTRSTIKGEQITIDNKGNIICKNCELEQEKQNNIKSSQDSVAFSQSNIDYAKEADLRIEVGSKDSYNTEDKVNEPSHKILIYVFTVLILIVISLLWYFVILKKKVL
ncbi:hypothetical protein [Sphingobacterium faecium]|uniref:hypothetical protein n=1 Tax=Sphingobacterium faecium TaxID=34087 RepID=UPI00247A280F|nr:hypothetical protein [Sphingobacterium faecium]WGQ15439.1 hypothetical protein QG727_03300 [Sphingobacterium faecium]